MASTKHVPHFQYLSKPGLFLPFLLAEQLNAKVIAKMEADCAKENAERAKRLASKKNEAISDDAEKILLDGEEFGAPPSPSTGPTMRMLNMQQVKAENADTCKDADERLAKNNMINLLATGGEYRNLGTIDPDLYRNQLDELERDFANFAEPIDYLRGVCALAAADDLTVRPDTMLLNGPPGVGKTLFCQRLAAIFGTTMDIAHLETMQTNGDLVGSSAMWSNSQEGLIFRRLALGKIGNPLILLDEIDKTQGEVQYSVEKALYNLLADTSSTFADAAYPWLTLDASRIVYVATSNYAKSIEPAIKSRLLQFDIAAPTRNQSRLIVRNIFALLQQEMPGAMSAMTLSKGAVDALLDHPPRKIKTAIKVAAGATAYKQKRIIAADDVVAAAKEKAPIGFC